jgi:hypothetical protein
MKRKSDAPLKAPPVDAPVPHPVHPHTSLMGHLRHLLGFAKEHIHLLNHRLNQRYQPGPDFPLTATLTLSGGAWTSVIRNISGAGLGLRVDPHTTLAAGQSARVGLELDRHHLDIRARIAHLQPGEDGVLAGLELKFDDFPTQKAYLELLHPIVIGQSLQPVDAHLVTQDEPRFIKQSYQGESGFSLTVRREDTAGEPLHSVEFRLNDYTWRIDRPPDAPPGWTPPAVAPDEPKPEPIYDSAGGLHFEVHDLFRWIAFNLSGAVPDDVRALVHPNGD